MIKKTVLEIIDDISKNIKYPGDFLNERYLHHYFSSKFLEKEDCLNLKSDEDYRFHTEWPTFKKKTNIEYRRYKKRDDKHYHPDENGSGGFIDFAIGNYDEPEIAIEFTLKYGWNTEEIIFDFLKILDSKNPFKIGISYNLILRENGVVQKGNLEKLERKMNESIEIAKKRLRGDVSDKSREIYLMITELDKYNNRRNWVFDRKEERFLRKPKDDV